MTAREERIYQEALALWQAVSDAPAPEGDASALMQAAINAAQPETYERICSRWLQDKVMTWAIYEDAPPLLA